MGWIVHSIMQWLGYDPGAREAARRYSTERSRCAREGVPEPPIPNTPDGLSIHSLATQLPPALQGMKIKDAFWHEKKEAQFMFERELKELCRAEYDEYATCFTDVKTYGAGRMMLKLACRETQAKLRKCTDPYIQGEFLMNGARKVMALRAREGSSKLQGTKYSMEDDSIAFKGQVDVVMAHHLEKSRRSDGAPTPTPTIPSDSLSSITIEQLDDVPLESSLLAGALQDSSDIHPETPEGYAVSAGLARYQGGGWALPMHPKLLEPRMSQTEARSAADNRKPKRDAFTVTSTYQGRLNHAKLDRQYQGLRQQIKEDQKRRSQTRAQWSEEAERGG